MTLIGSQNAYQLRGGFRPERGWWFEPLLADSVAVTAGEPAELNPWIRANHQVARHFVDVLQGNISAETGSALGLFDLERARQMELLFLPLWQSNRPRSSNDTGKHPTATAFDWKLSG
jgi:myo-inositol 2-dehydrogenase/D-chiro-inositol 1-dehydrogenase